ncbi:MAG: FecCD family ABC transporter permease [Sporichthyaceae bacterium]
MGATVGAARRAAPERGTRRGRAHTPTARAAGLTVACLCLILVALCSIAVGARPIPLPTVVEALFAHDATRNDHVVVASLRVPRTLMGILVGLSLGLAGAIMQGLTRNPLADPGILGIEAGAAMAVVVGIHTFGVATLYGYVWFAIVGAGVAAVAVYVLGSAGREGATPVKLALAGAALTAFLASATTAILLLDVATLDQYRFWVVGALAGRDSDTVAQVAPFVAVGALLALACGRLLNALALGDDVARSLGQRVGFTRGYVFVASILLAGAATAAAGPIGFIGLTVPHIARAITGPDYRWILPYSAVLAPILLLSADVVGRVVARPGEVQVGIVTALLGAPVFIWLVRRRTVATL